MGDIIPREQIYIDYKDRVYGYIISKLRNSHDAEDLLAGVFLKVYQNLDSYDSDKASLSTWIYTIAHNEVCNFFRAKSKFGFVADIDNTSHISDDSESSIEILLKEEQLEDLAKALDKLPERERAVLVLRFYHEYTPKEVAECINVSYSNAKFLQHRAIGMLRKIMLAQE